MADKGGREEKTWAWVAMSIKDEVVQIILYKPRGEEESFALKDHTRNPYSLKTNKQKKETKRKQQQKKE